VPSYSICVGTLKATPAIAPIQRPLLWTRLRVSFNACVDPLYVLQVIYRALTRQLTTDTLLLLSDQSGSVLGDSTVFSWAGCHRFRGVRLFSLLVDGENPST
jgi:hypothetical protein